MTVVPDYEKYTSYHGVKVKPRVYSTYYVEYYGALFGQGLKESEITNITIKDIFTNENDVRLIFSQYDSTKLIYNFATFLANPYKVHMPDGNALMLKVPTDVDPIKQYDYLFANGNSLQEIRDLVHFQCFAERLTSVVFIVRSQHRNNDIDASTSNKTYFRYAMTDSEQQDGLSPQCLDIIKLNGKSKDLALYNPHHIPNQDLYPDGR